MEHMKIPDEMVKNMDVTKFMIMDKRISEIPKGLQRIMERYTIALMKKLYNEEIYVFFCSFNGSIFEDGSAFFRDKNTPPVNFSDVETWEGNKKHSITFNSDFYKEDELCKDAWLVIIHEVTHKEIGMDVTKVGDEWEVKHNNNMNKLVLKNAMKVTDLATSFLKELDWTVEDIEKFVK